MIEITQDFRGRASNEIFYLKGTKVELDDEIENSLIAEGVAKKIIGQQEKIIPTEEQPEVKPVHKKVQK